MNRSVIVSAVGSAKLVNVAIPPDTVTVVVPRSGPEPVLREAVTLRRVVAGLHGCRTGLRHRPPVAG